MRRFFQAAVWLGLLLGGFLQARAAIQFDVFIGYDGVIREGNWFPVTCEVRNDGPTFKAVFELETEQGARGQVRQVAFELPTNTRKLIVIPVFGAGGRYSSWNARLIDDRGKVRAEHKNIRVKQDVAWESRMLGALPRTFGGLPMMPDMPNSRKDLEPAVARIQREHFPDNPLAMEGLNAIYLNTEKAIELTDPQINAIRLWLQQGGHLIVGIEQLTDVSGTPWLRNLLPCDVSDIVTVKPGDALRQWVRTRGGREEGRGMYARLTEERALEDGDVPLVVCQPRSDATVRASFGGRPAIIDASRGRGTITVLAFSPEREPVRSWKHKKEFWARMLEVPAGWYDDVNQNRNYGAMSIDGVFGSMIDSTQVRKLPVSWLLLLLLVYLAVIGPVDQYVLKKLNRQMLTWITFPSYVVLFSLLIYWIGFMLRAGETEWNELHVVDLLPRGERTDMRGRTYASVYSPSNARYALAGQQPFATLRGEFQGSWGGGGESSRSTVRHRGDGFSAEVFVPVWTSELYVNDWWQPGNAAITARLQKSGNQWQAVLENQLDRKLTNVRIVVDRYIYDVKELGPREKRTEALQGGKSLSSFVQEHGNQFQQAIQQRRNQFGGNSNFRVTDLPNATAAASFVEKMDSGQNNNNPNNYWSRFITPEGFDLSDTERRGNAVVLAWDAGNAPVQSLNQFNPRRTKRDTLYRLTIPATP